MIGDTIVFVRGTSSLGNGAWSAGTFLPAPSSSSSQSYNGWQVAVICATVLMAIGLVYLSVRHCRRRGREPRLFLEADAWEVPRSKVWLEEAIGSGKFGVVYRAMAEIDGQRSIVAVKQVRDKDVAAQRAFIREIKVMKSLASKGHRNLVSLKGVCHKSKPLCLIVEYMAEG